MDVLEIENVTKTFGDFTAVDSISLSIRKGSIFGLIGPNGAGKTTTIRMIMNIIAPDSGNIKILGRENNRMITDQIGYLPEERGLYKKMKVKELLLFLAELKSMDKATALEQIDYWIKKVELSDWKDEKVEELSKGMQQKIQFIGTVLHKPEILILDEPFGGLDPVNQNLIKDLIMELNNDGTTIIFSTHVMESAEKLCDEIFLINQGEEVLYDKLSKIKERFGKKNVIISFDGDDAFLDESKQIKKYNNYGNTVEIQLVKKADTQKLLKKAMQNSIIQKFEIVEPSLHEIFVESVSELNEQGDNDE